MARRAPARGLDGSDRRRRHRRGVAALRAELDYADWCTAFGEAGLRHAHVAGRVRRRAVARARRRPRRSTRCSTTTSVPRPLNIIGIGMGGPTVIAWGTEELKHQFLRGIATNEEIWCQLFSEPGAGSDVAGLGDARGARRRRVDRERPEGVDHARPPRQVRDARSRAPTPTCPKHKGLSYFIVDMHAAGRRGAAAACRSPATPSSTRCSSTDARVPDSMRGSGPRATGGGSRITTLMNERVVAVGRRVGRRRRRRRQPDRTGSSTATGRSPTPDLRQRLAQAWIDDRLIRSTTSAPPTGAQRRRGRARGLDHQAAAGGVQPAAAEARGRPRGRRTAVAWEGAGAHRGRRRSDFVARPSDDQRDRRARVPALRRPTPSRAARRTSCATSSASGCSGSRRSPTQSRDLPWKDVPRSA